MDEKLKNIVRKMIDNGESDKDIDYIIAEYNKKKAKQYLHTA
jgi:cytochrome c-type biogenesis protein CcmH/NrfF